jgi:hypothetical protein
VPTYQVMNRGDQREDVFRDDEDHQRFLMSWRGGPRGTVAK